MRFGTFTLIWREIQVGRFYVSALQVPRKTGVNSGTFSFPCQYYDNSRLLAF